MLQLKSFEDISGFDAGWLKAKHHFAIGPYGNPANKAVGNERRLMLASLRYLDTFTKVDGSWLFAERQHYS